MTAQRLASLDRGYVEPTCAILEPGHDRAGEIEWTKELRRDRDSAACNRSHARSTSASFRLWRFR